MSPLQVLVLPDALHSPNQGRIRPGCPLAGSRTAPSRHNRNSSSLFSFFFAVRLSPISWKSLPHNLRPCLYLYLILSPLCTLSLSVSLSTTPLPFPPTRVDYLSLFYCGLFLVRCLPLSGKQLLFSAQPTLCPFTVSSKCSLTSPQLLLFILFPLSVPLSSPLIQTHSAFI